MKVNLINKPIVKEKDGKKVAYDRFYLVADNGTTIGIAPEEGHSKDDAKMNAQIWVRNLTALRLLADKVDE